jgi:type I restriction enzyme, S subunit
MKRYDRYSKYEDRWITSLPSHWGYKRLKEVLKERKEKNSPVKTHNILSLTNTRGVIPYSEKGNVGNKAKESLEGYMLAYPNDIVINSMNIIIGSVGLSKYFGAVSPVYYMLYTRNNDNIRYFNYVFQNKPFQESLRGLGNGILEIRMRIPMYKLNNVCIPVPPRSEQDQRLSLYNGVKRS